MKGGEGPVALRAPPSRAGELFAFAAGHGAATFWLVKMMNQTPPRSGADRVLLLEAVLTLLFFALFVMLYFVPAGGSTFRPRWWAWPVLVGLFFGILSLEQWRRKRRAKSGLSNALPESEVTEPEDLR